MTPLELTKLTALVHRASGSPKVKIGLIDGPVASQHPDLVSENLHEIPGGSAACTQTSSAACMHGTFVAGILSAKRSSVAPAICPGCTLLIRPIFREKTMARDQLPSATPLELATAINQCIDSNVRVINLSLAVAQASSQGEQPLEEALSRTVS